MRGLRAGLRLSVIGWFGLLAVFAGCGGNAPELEPIAPRSVVVSEMLVIPLTVKNAGSESISFRVEVAGGKPPGFDRVASIAAGPAGGEFRWTPLSSHVGVHELTFTASSSGGSSTQTALVTVEPAADSAPVFVRPGAGSTFDLTREACVVFDIEVRDDDSSSVDIRVRGEGLDGALLDSTGPKSARFDWCPTPDQVAASSRYSVSFEADDGSHDPTPKDFVIVLRGGAKEGCAGAPPVVSITSPSASAQVAYDRGYFVDVTVTDDLGIREAPLLYYSLAEPEDASKLDLSGFEQVVLSANGSRWSGRIPSLGLATGDEATVYFLVVATDNDDSTGTACDQVTESPLRSFTAVGGTSSPGPNGEFCGASTDCLSGLCGALAGGARCLEECSDGAVCTTGECLGVSSIEGRPSSGCQTASACLDDSYEENDVRTSATLYSSPLTAQVCADDSDFFRFAGASGTRVVVTLDGFDASAVDLDLQLQSQTGRVLGLSAGITGTEEAAACIDSAGAIYARVYGFDGAESPYALRATSTPGTCCSADTFEPNDTSETARGLTFAGVRASVDARLCPGDEDYFAFTLTSAQRVRSLLVFDTSGGMSDVDLQLYDSEGVLVGESRSSTDSESIEMDLAAGTYALRVFAYTDEGVDYLLDVEKLAAGGCSSTNDCSPGNVCASSACVSAACTGDASCPAAHFCPLEAIDPSRVCSLECASNTDCRSSEACKWYLDGRACGRRGSSSNGASCSSHGDCGGQRACIGWNRGYCARGGCSTNADCESGSTFCSDMDGLDVCVLDCSRDPSLCRVADGYACSAVTDKAGASRFACVPAASR
jgi:hypothetical protein